MVLWFVVVGEANLSWGILLFVGEINHVVSLLERWRLRWGKSLRTLEVVSAGERFSEIKLLLGNHPMRRILSLPLAANVCGISKKCLTVRNPFYWDWRSMPQVTEMEACPWLLCNSWEISWNLDWTAPGVLDSDMSCPLVDRRFVNGSVILFEVILFTERAFVHRIFVVWISPLSNK